MTDDKRIGTCIFSKLESCLLPVSGCKAGFRTFKLSVLLLFDEGILVFLFSFSSSLSE